MTDNARLPVFEVEDVDRELKITVRRGDRAQSFRISPEAALELARQLYTVATAAVVRAAKGKHA